jgi:hypothetical protein
MGIFWVGIGLGVFLFLAKLGIFLLLTSKKNEKTGELEQRILPKWLLWGKPMPIRDRINQSTFLLVCVDTISGYIGMHAFASFQAGTLAMIAMAAYTIICAATLGWQFLFKWLLRKLSFKSKPKHSWREA